MPVFQVIVQTDSGEVAFDLPPRSVTRIGRDPECEICLPSPFVSHVHASLALEGGRLKLKAEGLNPTIVNEREVLPHEPVDLRAGDTIVIQGWLLRVRTSDTPQVASDAEHRARFVALVAGLHESVINHLDPRVFRLDSIKTEQGRQSAMRVLNEEIDAVNVADFKLAVTFGAREALRTSLLSSILGQTSGADLGVFGGEDSYAKRETTRIWLVSKLGDALGLKLDGSDAREGLRKLREGFDRAFLGARGHITDDLAQHLLLWLARKDVCDLIFGLGPLTDLVRMPDVSEIMVVSRDLIYIEQGGTLEETGRTFVSDRVSEQILERILGPLNRRVDRSSPMVDARLLDGSRVNAIIPPLALKGPCITIRRFSQDPLTIDDLVGFGAISAQVATFLRACVKGRKNIIISGGTGSGKTTLLNALSGWIPSHERIVTIEDTAELRLQQRHVVTLEARPANIEQKGEVTIRDLVRNALRMRPDRIIVGECRGKEAFDMLQAMNTGHDGSMTTGHANSPSDMLQRLESMVLESAQLPLQAIRRQVASAIDIVIQQSRHEGRRRVLQVSELVGLDDSTGEAIVEDIFVHRSDIGLQFTGYLPTFADDLVNAGLLNPLDMFKET